MEEVIQILMGIRSQLDAVIVGLSASDTDKETRPSREKPVVESGCKHKNTQEVGGMGGSRERTVCVDCKEEV